MPSRAPLVCDTRPPRHELRVDPPRDLAQGKDRFHAADLHRRRRHAGDHRRAAVLGHPATPRGADRAHTLGAVAAMPVSTTPMLLAPNTWATERNSGSAAGRTPHTGGSWFSAMA